MVGRVSIGALFSTDGTYHRMGLNALTGAQHAVRELNERGDLDFELCLEQFNPEGRLELYSSGVRMLNQQGIRHIFGPITSAGRKEIIPDIEQQGSLLWFSCPYEGFESSEHVVYLGGCPNQTLIPLLRYAIERYGDRAYLLGSNYVWGWESNRIAREVLDAAGGIVCGEKYCHLGTTAFADWSHGLVQSPPAFILNNLVGESSHAFLHQLDAACVKAGLVLPVLSCNLTEGELVDVGELRALRLLSCGPFFDAVDMAFGERQRKRHGLHPYSHYYAGAYAAVHLFAAACQAIGSDDPAGVRQALYASPVSTALGPLHVSSRNNHTGLPCYIAELRQGRFEIVHAEISPRSADPYLTATDLEAFRTLRTRTASRHLRIVK